MKICRSSTPPSPVEIEPRGTRRAVVKDFSFNIYISFLLLTMTDYHRKHCPIFYTSLPYLYDYSALQTLWLFVLSRRDMAVASRVIVIVFESVLSFSYSLFAVLLVFFLVFFFKFFIFYSLFFYSSCSSYSSCSPSNLLRRDLAVASSLP